MMGKTLVCDALVLILLISCIAHAVKDCYILPSRPGRCVYILPLHIRDQCHLRYAGFQYAPQTEADLKEIQRIAYWRDIETTQFVTGLVYYESIPRLTYYLGNDLNDNIWEPYSGPLDVEFRHINFDKSKSYDDALVIIEIKPDLSIHTYAEQLPLNSLMLCEASTHPSLPCPSDFQIYRPTKRCFKPYIWAHEVRTPEEAEKTCRTENAIVGTVNTEGEDTFLMRMAPKRQLLLGMRFAWKEIKKTYSRGTNPTADSPNFMDFVKRYMYNIDGFPVTYHHFHSSQPDFNTPNEYFIIRESDGFWHDYPGDRNFGFTCSTLPDQSYATSLTH